VNEEDDVKTEAELVIEWEAIDEAADEMKTPVLRVLPVAEAVEFGILRTEADEPALDREPVEPVLDETDPERLRPEAVSSERGALGN